MVAIIHCIFIQCPSHDLIYVIMNVHCYTDNGFVTLESELYLDQFLGFTANGDVMLPTKVDPDSPCGKFLVRVMNIVSWR